MLDELFEMEVFESPRFLVSATLGVLMIFFLLGFWEGQGYDQVGIIKINLLSKIIFSVIGVIFAYFWTLRKLDDD